MLGSALRSLGAIGLPRERLDVTRPQDWESVLAHTRPDAVIHCAALTQVDACAVDPRAWSLNVESAAWIAARVETWLVSTNYVFDGPGPHAPQDPREPAMAYGVQKAAAEDAVLAAGGHVVRTGWLYGPGGRNFPSRLPELLLRGPVQALEGWPVQPTWAPDLAEHLLTLPKGVSHAIGAEQTTWADFARAVCPRLGVPVSRVVGVNAIRGMGPRPADARLSGHLLPGFSRRLDDWVLGE